MVTSNATIAAPQTSSSVHKADEVKITFTASALKQLPLGCVQVARGGQIVEWNSRATSMLGWSFDEACGKNFCELLHIGPGGSDGPSWRDFLVGHVLPLAADLISETVRHKDGRSLEVSLMTCLLEYSEEQYLAVFLEPKVVVTEVKVKKRGEWIRGDKLANDLPIAIGYFDQDEKCCFFNEAAVDLLNAPEEYEGMSFRSIVGERVYANYRLHLSEIPKEKQGAISFDTAERYGTSTHQSMRFLPDFDANGIIQGMCMMVFDSTVQQNALSERGESARHLQSIADNMPALISHLDLQHRTTFANATFKLWMNTEPSSLIGRPLSDVLGKERYEVRRPLLDRALSGEKLSFESSTPVNGVMRDFKTSYLPDTKPDGSIVGVFVLVTDITSLKTLERHLEELVRIDSLTGLPNRRQFEARLAEALNRTKRTDRGFAVMFLDLDRFKSINDSQGHAVGDEVLKQFAARLLLSIRRSDTVARLGGDEFVILLDEIKDASDTIHVAEKIHSLMQEPILVGQLSLTVTTSIGIALASNDDTEKSLLAKADAALYNAKEDGRNTYALHHGISSREG